MEKPLSLSAFEAGIDIKPDASPTKEVSALHQKVSSDQFHNHGLSSPVANLYISTVGCSVGDSLKSMNSPLSALMDADSANTNVENALQESK